MGKLVFKREKITVTKSEMDNMLAVFVQQNYGIKLDHNWTMGWDEETGKVTFEREVEVQDA